MPHRCPNSYLKNSIEVQRRIIALNSNIKNGKALIILISQYMRKHNRDVYKIMADIESDMSHFMEKYEGVKNQFQIDQKGTSSTREIKSIKGILCFSYSYQLRSY
jgi:hypothetical protein